MTKKTSNLDCYRWAHDQQFKNVLKTSNKMFHLYTFLDSDSTGLVEKNDLNER